MIKYVFLGGNREHGSVYATRSDHYAAQAEGDRWYFRYHAREVVETVGPWLRLYENYSDYSLSNQDWDYATSPAVGQPYGLNRTGATELWFASLNLFKEAMSYPISYTPPPGGFQAISANTIIVPAAPTEVFIGPGPAPEERPIMRWYFFFKYPDGVPVEKGEDWFLNIHVPEERHQPQLLKYFSHRVIPNPETRPFIRPKAWVRLTEMWYEDLAAWRQAVIENPPSYTKPPWGGAAPFVEMYGTFIHFKPRVDFLKDKPIIP